MNAAVDCPPNRATDAAAAHAAGWRAALSLAYLRRGGRTVLAARRHCGPLVVQRPFYPEGEAVCHTILVHPPAGIAGGDHLSIDVAVGPGAHVLATTPGAGKWYRSSGPRGRLEQRIDVATGGVCEWLPQESIVFDAALGELSTEVVLEPDACFIGIEMLCLGRTGAGERFARGALALHTRIVRAGRPLWLERGCIDGGGRLLASPVGLGGEPVTGTLVAASPRCDRALLDACREIPPAAGEGAVTLLPGLIVARYRGPACEPGRQWLTRLWAVLRPILAGRTASIPRIWHT